MIGKKIIGFLKNNFKSHSENIRVRHVPKKTILYYEMDDIYLAVPTFGFIYIIIDFGRAVLKPWGASDQMYMFHLFSIHMENVDL